MRVLLVSYHFPPSDQVGARRAARIVEHMAGLGHSVDVLCASLDDGVGSLDPGESWSAPPGTSVVRIPTPFRLARNPARPPREGGGLAWWKLRAYLEKLFLVEDWSLRWGRKAAEEALPRLSSGRYDVVIAEGPPNPAVVPVLRAAMRTKVPTIVDLRDMWPSSGSALKGRVPPGVVPLPGLRRDVWNLRLKSEVLAGASAIVVTTHAIADLLTKDAAGMDVEPPAIRVVTNAYSAPDCDSLSETRHGDPGIRLAYTGSLAYGRDRQMVELIRAMSVVRPELDEDMTLEIVGPSLPEFEDTISGWPHADFVTVSGSVPRHEAVAIQRRADALVLLQPDDKLWTRTAIPAKLFEYMERRRNILALVPRGPAAEIVERYDLGCVAADPGELEEGVRRLVERVRSVRVLPPPPEEFSAEATMSEFAAIVTGIADKSRPTAISSP